MRDTIYRESAIDALDKEYRCTDKSDDWDGLETAMLIIENLPSAQSELKKGKWIVHYECPKCGEITKDFTEYCPFCNADMRGEQDG